MVIRRLHVVLALFVLFLIFIRVYNLENTARFIWDESSDLVRMHQYFVEKNLSLVGPITEDGSRVYGSLTYYMLMPFTIAFNFDPIGPVTGAVFWGILTAIILAYLIYKINKSWFYPGLILLVLWYPLVETSRWAWNPNLIPFWMALSLVFYLRNTRLNLFLSGLCLGLTIHHHYLSLFAIAGFCLAVLIDLLRKKQLLSFLPLAGGIVLMILPFIVFDYLHPPGLFLTRALYFNNSQFSGLSIWYQYMLKYYFQLPVIELVAGVAIPLLLLFDIFKRNRSLIFASAWVVQLVGLMFIYNPGAIYYYYHIPGVVFFILWILYPRIKQAHSLAQLLLALLIIGSIISIYPQLHKSNWQTDIPAVRKVSSILVETIKSNHLENLTLAVLASPDNNTYGRRYRDMVLLQDISFKNQYEYTLADHMFVVSTSSAEVVRNDAAAEMNLFRRGPLVNQWTIDNSPWHLYHFTRH